MNKAELRKTFLQKRQSLTEKEVEHLSEQICQQFFNHFPLQEVKHLHVFLPIADQKEVNTWLIIRRLQRDFAHIKVVASRTNWKSRSMEHYYLLPETQLQESSLGIPEPVDAEHCPIEHIDMVLLPLLSFDLKGNRVGYGAGFYDRFLGDCQKNAQKVGLSLFDLIQEIIPDAAGHDVPMDACICPEKVYFFEKP